MDDKTHIIHTSTPSGASYAPDYAGVCSDLGDTLSVSASVSTCAAATNESCSDLSNSLITARADTDTNTNINTDTDAEYCEAADGAKSPLRRCIVSGQSLPKDNLIRFVVAPDRSLIPDIYEKLPGRGLWVEATDQAISEAIDKKRFAWAARGKVTLPDDLLGMVQNQVKQRLRNQLALANRCGDMAAGIEKSMDVLRSGQAGLYATSSSPESDARSGICHKNPDLPVVDCFTSEELGTLIGRESITHIIVKKGNICFKGVQLHRLYQQLGGKALGNHG